MARPRFSFRDTTHDGLLVKVVTFEIPDGFVTPAEFAEATADLGTVLAGSFGVILDGRGPVWGYGMLVHAAHPSLFVATRDPRHGAVVVQSHSEGIRAGDVIEFP